MPFLEILSKGAPLNKANKSLILLHGRGGSARDILAFGDVFCDDSFHIAALQAPGHTWYPHGFMVEEELNEPFLSSSVENVKNLINKISKHILKSHIYLMGFSQGACLALEVSARFATKYGGVIAFTGGLIGKKIREEKYHGNFDRTKIFIGNSDHDPHVPLVRSEESKALLERMGGDVTLKVYKGMGHVINEDEINWVKKYIF